MFLALVAADAFKFEDSLFGRVALSLPLIEVVIVFHCFTLCELTNLHDQQVQ